MKDWREELQHTEPEVKKPKDPSLCQCMANMKGRWIGGKYTCLRCGRPVYDALGKDDPRHYAWVFFLIHIVDAGDGLGTDSTPTHRMKGNRLHDKKKKALSYKAFQNRHHQIPSTL